MTVAPAKIVPTIKITGWETAGAVGIAALTAFLACGEGMMNLVKGRKDPKPTEYKSIGPTATLETEVKDPQPIPGSCMEGSLGVPRLCAV